MRIKWTLKKIQRIALKHSTRNDFQELDSKAYQAARKRGILDEVCAHMPTRVDTSGKNNSQYKWEDEELKLVASKYDSISEFAKKEPLIYQTIRRRKLLKQHCNHMVRYTSISGKNCHMFRWEDEELLKESANFKRRTEFARNSNAYSICIKRNMLEKACSHMKKSSTVSIPELYIFHITKDKFPKTQKLYDRKVQINNKPYIHGFDIDIYIPELRKGIEFDGKYYHSFKFMREDPKKELWPDEDILNYHQIKDDWFLSKGIELLHIKEKDWEDNKDLCMQKISAFLEVDLSIKTTK